MSLVRYLPVPSDRMGIIWSLLNISDSVVLEYGPAGTTHYSMGLYGGLGIRFQNRLFTTHINEDDVVMGDVTRLEEAILEIDKNYEPKVIFVVASSVTAVIGTDIKGVCRYMQQEVKAKLLPIEQSGFNGDYSTGVSEIYKVLVKNLLVENRVKHDDSYNILGASAWHYRIASDLWEVENLLKEGFNLTCNARLCCNTSVEEIEQMSGVKLNIVLSCEGLPAAELLKERYGIPYVYTVPYGYQGTIDFLEAVGEVLNIAADPMLIMRLNMKKKALAMLGMFKMMSGKTDDKMQAVIKGEYDTVIGVAEFLKAGGIEVKYKISAHSLKNIPDVDKEVLACENEKQWLDLVRPLRKTLILADDVLLSQCSDDNTKIRLSTPYIKGSQTARHLPFMGEKGADFLLEIMQEYYQK